MTTFSKPFIWQVSVFGLVLGLSACSSAPEQASPGSYPEPNKGRYSQAKDSIPLRLPTESEMQDPDPTVEPLSRGGNKPYNIYGIDYSPNTNILQYDEKGVASWYGSKFHGHHTSNGEVYNVFSMTAAHKTLPLPSYVRVTNLDNHRTAIVRVNDRGPFHDNRIIDLSYSAAYKLGIFQSGTGRVRVELIASPAMNGQASFATAIAQEPNLPSESQWQEDTPAPSSSDAFVERPYTPGGNNANIDPPPVTNAAPATPSSRPRSNNSSGSGCFIQLIASSNQAKVEKLGNEIQQQWSVATQVQSANGLYRLLAGPLQYGTQALQMLEQARSGAYPNAYFSNKKLCADH